LNLEKKLSNDIIKYEVHIYINKQMDIRICINSQNFNEYFLLLKEIIFSLNRYHIQYYEYQDLISRKTFNEVNFYLPQIKVLEILY
jgi:hypothetical protein